jgi:putative ABC transport system substrate-binding protein
MKPVARVLVLKSANVTQYDVPVESFTSLVNGQVRTMTLGDNEEVLQQEIISYAPSLVFTLGTKAALFARERLRDQPVLFSMVVNYARLGLGTQENFFGVSLELPALAEFSQFKMVVPTIKRVAVFYEPKVSEAIVTSARTELSSIGVELVAMPISEPKGLPAAYAKVRGVDAIWLLSDQVVINQESFSFLRDSAQRDRILLLASVSEKLAQAGAAIAVASDLTSVGGQAAAMANQFFESGQMPELRVQAPIGARIFVNMTVIQALQLTIAPDVFPLIQPVGWSDQIGAR